MSTDSDKNLSIELSQTSNKIVDEQDLSVRTSRVLSEYQEAIFKRQKNIDDQEDEKITSVYEQHNENFVDNNAPFWFMVYSPIPVLSENSYYLFLWKCIVLLTIYFSFASYAWEIVYTYRNPSWNGHLDILLAYAQLVLWIDLILNFHVTYTKRGRTIKNKAFISWHYIKYKFCFDVFALSSMFIFHQRFNLLVEMVCITLFFLSKLPSTNTITSFIDDHLQIHRLFYATYKVLRICFLLLIATTIMALLFYLAGAAAIENDKKHSWLNAQSGYGNIGDLETEDQLLLAFYWAFGTLTMMNNGDITPKNTYEILVYFLAILIGINLFALSIGFIQDIITILFSQQSELKEQLKLMTIYMRQRGIPNELQNKVLAYLGEVIYQKQQNDDELEQTLIQLLPPNFRQELSYQTYRVVFEAIDIMMLFNDSFKQSLSVEFEQQIFSEGDIIYLDHQFDETGYCLYYISCGELGVFMNTNGENKMFYRLKAGRFFGLTSFITDQPRIESIAALTYCRLFVISKTKFLQVINLFPIEKEKYHNLVHNAVFNDCLSKFCYSCDSVEHDLNQCSDMTYVPNPERLQYLQEKAFKRESPELQLRQKNLKRRPKTQKALLDLSRKTNIDKLRNVVGECNFGCIDQMVQLESQKSTETPEFILLNKIYQMMLKMENEKNQSPSKIEGDQMQLEQMNEQFDKICDFIYFQPHNNIELLIREGELSVIKNLDAREFLIQRARKQSIPRNRFQSLIK